MDINKKQIQKKSDNLMKELGADACFHLASSLFQRTIDIAPKSKWSAPEDQLIETFFFLSSKEEMCEALECDMVSLHRRAKALGVLAPDFDTLNSYDLELALKLFSQGSQREDVIELYGIPAVAIPAGTLSNVQKAVIYQKIQSSNFQDNPDQGDLFH